MPTTTPVLFRGLVDDAAAFPPAALPLPDAVRAHAVHRTSWYAGCVGPLLVPAASVADLVTVLDERDAGGAPAVGTPAGAGATTGVAVPPGGAAAPLDLVLISRPGADPATVTAALDALRDEDRVKVVGAELAWHDGWCDLGLDALAVALEVPRGPDQPVAVADVHSAHADGVRVVAKFRTGPTPTWPWPDDGELASFVGLCATLDVPFKLTGGLHHAVRGTYAVDGIPEENHGVLNVLLATAAALEGAGSEEVAGLLGVRDADALAGLVGAWTDQTSARVRAAFTAYGCCTVTDPVGELADLGLLARPRPAARPTAPTDRPPASTEGPP